MYGQFQSNQGQQMQQEKRCQSLLLLLLFLKRRQSVQILRSIGGGKREAEWLFSGMRSAPNSSSIPMIFFFSR